MITKPMLAETIEDLSEVQFPVGATPKLDGIRCLVVNGKALTRKFKPIPNHHIRNHIEKYCVDGFDGEIVCFGKTFNEIQSLVMTEEGEPNFTYVVFDYVKDDLNKPYTKRLLDFLALPDDILGRVTVLVPTPVTNLEELNAIVDMHIKKGYEGTMIRTLNSPYKNGRSTVKQGWLLKIKQFRDAEAYILGFEEKMTNNNELETNELGYAKRSSHKANLEPAGTLGSLFVRDKVSNIAFSIGTGFDDELRQKIWNNRDEYMGEVITYTFQPSGMKDKPRFPSFKGFRDERDM